MDQVRAKQAEQAALKAAEAEARRFPVIVKSYKSRSQDHAAQQMAKDATKLAARGYVVASQSWQSKGHSIKSKVPLGLLVLATRSGEGTLTVTFQHRSQIAALAGAAT